MLKNKRFLFSYGAKSVFCLNLYKGVNLAIKVTGVRPTFPHQLTDKCATGDITRTSAVNLATSTKIVHMLVGFYFVIIIETVDWKYKTLLKMNTVKKLHHFSICTEIMRKNAHQLFFYFETKLIMNN